MPVEEPSNIYRERLTSLYHGLALWKPNPVEGIYNQVSIGDVGYITSHGIFIRMFNVTLPWDDQSNRRLAEPEHYDRLTLASTVRETFGQVDYYSRHVSREENAGNRQAMSPEQTEGVTYICRGPGALLSLPCGGYREDAIHQRMFRERIRDNVDSWFNWSRNVDLPVDRMDDLILVTGCTLVTSYAAAVLDDHIADAQVSLASIPLNNGGTSFIWSNIRGTVEYNDSQLNANIPSAPLNRCVFIRGFRAKRVLFWTKPIRAAAEPHLDDPDDPGNHQMEDIQVNQVPYAPKYLDPLNGVLDYIAEKCLEVASAEGALAIVHDDDLQIIKSEDLETLTSDAVLKFLHENKIPVLIENGVATLQDDKISSTRNQSEHFWRKNYVRHHRSRSGFNKRNQSFRVTVDMLFDDILLEIFYFYLYEEQTGAWYALVHVCRRWRNVVFGSPHRLNLRLLCTAGTPVRKTLDVWPHLPIVVMVNRDETWWDKDDIDAILKCNNRVCEIDFWLRSVPNSQLEKLFARMQQPFPVLTHLRLHCEARGETVPVVPTFFGGYAPQLQSLILGGIPFLGLPKLLLSAVHLVTLELSSIPRSGYISPEVIVNSLSYLTRLKRLAIAFDSPRWWPDTMGRLPRTRRILPALTTFQFKGVDQYLEDLVARIDAPLLDDLEITFFYQLIFHTPRLTQFISRTHKFNAYDRARVVFSGFNVRITLSQNFEETLKLGILSNQSEWQLLSLAQIHNSFFPQGLLHTVEHLHILENEFWRPDWQDDVENDQWLEILRPFTAVKDLHMSQAFVPRITPALRELVGERVTEVLPALRSVFLEESLSLGPVQDVIGQFEQFVAARQLAGHLITISQAHGGGRY